MTKPAISIQGLWKEYQIGGMRPAGETFYDVLSGALRRPFRRVGSGAEPSSTTQKFWALRDINVDVQPGEVVGVIGRNGAGKSTLLKVLSRITAPTLGHVEVRGRLASLLEVGTGFHPELSGRENVFLNGAILGMSRRDIARKFDEIIAFAEVEKFIDTPVKRYSSGMYVRLAFAVAAHLDCDVLVVDEVLAVGDAKFQDRCLGRIRELSLDGRTTLLVSHNMLPVRRLCSRVVWLSDGSVRAADDTPAVLDQYESLDRSSQLAWTRDGQRLVNEETVAQIATVGILVDGERESRGLTVDQNFTVVIEFENYVAGAQLHASINVYDSSGVHVLNSFPITEIQGLAAQRPTGLIRVACDLPAHLLNAGAYRLEAFLVRNQTVVVDHVESACQFHVNDIELNLAWHGKWRGVVRPLLPWRTI